MYWPGQFVQESILNLPYAGWLGVCPPTYLNRYQDIQLDFYPFSDLISYYKSNGEYRIFTLLGIKTLNWDKILYKGLGKFEGFSACRDPRTAVAPARWDTISHSCDQIVHPGSKPGIIWSFWQQRLWINHKAMLIKGSIKGFVAHECSMVYTGWHEIAPHSQLLLQFLHCESRILKFQCQCNLPAKAHTCGCRWNPELSGRSNNRRLAHRQALLMHPIPLELQGAARTLKESLKLHPWTLEVSSLIANWSTSVVKSNSFPWANRQLFYWSKHTKPHDKLLFHRPAIVEADRAVRHQGILRWRYHKTSSATLTPLRVTS